MEDKLICVLLSGEGESEEIVDRIADSYKDCPYVNFMATKGKKIYSIYFLPQKQKLWIESIEKNPQGTIGLNNAQLHFIEKVRYPKRMNLRLPKKLQDISPCGANCGKCTSSEKCNCCPATIYYKL